MARGGTGPRSRPPDRARAGGQQTSSPRNPKPLRNFRRIGPCCVKGLVVQRNHGSPVRPRLDPEEKVRSPDPGAQHGSRHPRGVIADNGRSVAGLRNCEQQMASTALWVGLQLEASQDRRGHPRNPRSARLVTENRVGGRRFEFFGSPPAFCFLDQVLRPFEARRLAARLSRRVIQ